MWWEEFSSRYQHCVLRLLRYLSGTALLYVADSQNPASGIIELDFRQALGHKEVKDAPVCSSDSNADRGGLRPRLLDPDEHPALAHVLDLVFYPTNERVTRYVTWWFAVLREMKNTTAFRKVSVIIYESYQFIWDMHRHAHLLKLNQKHLSWTNVLKRIARTGNLITLHYEVWNYKSIMTVIGIA